MRAIRIKSERTKGNCVRKVQEIQQTRQNEEYHEPTFATTDLVWLQAKTYTKGTSRKLQARYYKKTILELPTADEPDREVIGAGDQETLPPTVINEPITPSENLSPNNLGPEPRRIGRIWEASDRLQYYGIQEREDTQPITHIKKSVKNVSNQLSSLQSLVNNALSSTSSHNMDSFLRNYPEEGEILNSPSPPRRKPQVNH